MLRLVPEVALKFGLNDQLKIMFTPADGRPMSFNRKLAAGATAGVLKVTYMSCPSLPMLWSLAHYTTKHSSLSTCKQASTSRLQSHLTTSSMLATPASNSNVLSIG